MHTTSSTDQQHARTHELKTWRPYFRMVALGQKSFEVRHDDRGYRTGDVVLLLEFDQLKNEFTGRGLRAVIGYIERGDRHAFGDLEDASDQRFPGSLLPRSVVVLQLTKLTTLEGKPPHMALTDSYRMPTGGAL